MKRGQATVELALASPFIVGLLALTLQGGIVISDQVNLEHYTYEGAQWALAHPDAPLTGAGSVREHVTQQMCNGAATVPQPGGTRYCLDQTLSGLAPSDNLSIQVARSVGNTPTSQVRPSPTSQVLAASTCNPWALSVTVNPSSGSISASDTATYTVTLSITDVGRSDPVVNLSASNLPPGLANGTPYFVPPSLSTNSSYGRQAVLVVDTAASTVVGDYPIAVTGVDQCGIGPSSPPTVTPLTIAAGGNFGAPPVHPPVSVSAAVPICGGAASTVRVTGSGFQAGASVQLGTTAAGPVTFVNSGEVDAAVTLSSGVYDITVTNPDLSQGVSAEGLVVLPGAPCPPTAAAAPVRACATISGSYETVITIQWSEPLALPWLTSGSPPSVHLSARQLLTCQT